MVSFPGLYRRAVHHWRGIVTLLILARAAFYVIYPDEFGRFFDLIVFALLLVFIAGQIFWIKRMIDFVGRFLPSGIGRTRLAVIAVLIISSCTPVATQAFNPRMITFFGPTTTGR